MRVPISASMFQKANHKAMAVMLYPLLIFFDRKTFEPLFEKCWFPFALAEMKEFKITCLFVADELARRGIFPGHHATPVVTAVAKGERPADVYQNNILTKQVLENASGVKIWHALREISDIAVEFRIQELEEDQLNPFLQGPDLTNIDEFDAI